MMQHVYMDEVQGQVCFTPQNTTSDFLGTSYCSSSANNPAAVMYKEHRFRIRATRNRHFSPKISGGNRFPFWELNSHLFSLSDASGKNVFHGRPVNINCTCTLTLPELAVYCRCLMSISGDALLPKAQDLYTVYPRRQLWARTIFLHRNGGAGKGGLLNLSGTKYFN